MRILIGLAGFIYLTAGASVAGLGTLLGFCGGVLIALCIVLPDLQKANQSNDYTSPPEP
jgi:hypothetical protein